MCFGVPQADSSTCKKGTFGAPLRPLKTRWDLHDEPPAWLKIEHLSEGSSQALVQEGGRRAVRYGGGP